MKYKILILDIYPKVNYRISKDLNGGYGTANDYGDSWFSQLLKLYVKDTINFPPLYSVQVCGELIALGHEVDFRNNSQKVIYENYDLILKSITISILEGPKTPDMGGKAKTKDIGDSIFEIIKND